MSEQIPNIHDPDIREMVLSDHRPEEFWTTAGKLLSVACRRCGNQWPCASIEAARSVKRGLEQIK